MADLRYRAVWPKVSLHIDGKDVVIQRGDDLPKGVSNAHAAMLATFGAVIGAEPAPRADAQPLTASPAGPPAKSAKKSDWETFAVSQGMAEADAKAAKKDDLVAQFGAGTSPGTDDPDADPDGGDSPDGDPDRVTD